MVQKRQELQAPDMEEETKEYIWDEVKPVTTGNRFELRTPL